ncbi:hypothetical protein CA13_69440 [Planctomycetes bacterium CA13]|uniref:Uncharacterized protein n=1 Tax=Novipirellula herctigrandis TaxID=2527986 RepID=A0A5C5YNX8_9BACT|nr:hypothetical protein CA13_69440 [Planctomycetes bacterium CA13]
MLNVVILVRAKCHRRGGVRHADADNRGPAISKACILKFQFFVLETVSNRRKWDCK